MKILMTKITLGLICLIILSGCLAANRLNQEPYYYGPISDHFDGQRFKSKSHKSFSDLAEFYTTPGHDWSKSIIYDKNPKSNNEAIIPTKNKITFIGHSTILIETANFNILTDPIWSDRAGPVGIISPKRVNPPAIAIDDLPHIDYILISHNHYDHMDIATIKTLKQKFDPKFITGLGNCYYLNEKKDLDIDCLEMDWNEVYKIDHNLSIYFLEANHWSKRSINDTNKTLWGSFAIISDNFKAYFAGDTGYGDHFKKIGNKFNGFDVALLPIGAYKPRWFMKDNHINPKEAAQAHINLKAKKSIAIHYKTFNLGKEDYFDPIFDLQQAETELEIDQHDFLLPAFGETFYF
jgi:L-ascorbate metabolism protein UlaG (beta-lactamase superfamily)